MNRLRAGAVASVIVVCAACAGNGGSTGGTSGTGGAAQGDGGANGTSTGGAGNVSQGGSGASTAGGGGGVGAGQGTGGTSSGQGGGAGGASQGSGGAAGGSVAGTGGGTPPAGKVPMFLAQGQVGRTTISCDDGKTWVGNRSWDQVADPHLCNSTTPVVCYTGTCSRVWFDGSCDKSSPCVCHDHPGSSKGGFMAYGDGVFVGTWGWGWPGAVRRSSNGVDWETVIDKTGFGGASYAGGRFVVSGRNPRISTDGKLWTAGGLANFRELGGVQIDSVRRFGSASIGNGLFVAVASGNNGKDVLISADGGLTWHRPKSLPASCGNGQMDQSGGILPGAGKIVIIGGDHTACSSIDGETWTAAPMGGAVFLASHAVWSGKEFWMWDSDTRLSSPDAVTWTATPMKTKTAIGPVTRGDSGTLVAIGNVWNGYDKQVFLRSTDDGLTWTKLAAGTFAASHGIFTIVFGYGDASAECPAP